jgi:hypothetical protein
MKRSRYSFDPVQALSVVRRQSGEGRDVCAASFFVFSRGVHRLAVLKALRKGSPKGSGPTIPEGFDVLFSSPPQSGGTIALL